jgi:carbon storage regulator
MLILSRKPGEKVITSNGITFTVVEVNRKRVRVGIDAPDHVHVLRAELACRLEHWPPFNGLEVGKVRRLADLSAGGDDPFDHAPRLPPKTERNGNVKVITFTAGQERNVDNVVATELEGLTDDLWQCHLLLDFTNVEYVTGVELETLISIHKKMKASGGRLTLFNLKLQVFEVFTACRLESLFGICR